MPLTPQQIEEYRQRYNITPRGASGASRPSATGTPSTGKLTDRLKAGEFRNPGRSAAGPTVPESGPDERSIGRKVVDAIVDNPVSDFIEKLPGGKIGEAVGTAVGGLGALARDAVTDGPDIFPQYQEDAQRGPGSGQEAVKVAADGANAAITAASMGASLPAKIIPKVAAASGIGGAAAGTRAVAEGKPTDQVVQDAGIGAAAGGVLTAVTAPLGNVTKEAGKTIHKMAVPLSAREAQIMQNYRANTPFWKRVGAVLAGNPKTPRTTEETAFAKKLVGTEGMLGVQAKQASQKLWKDLIGPRLQASGVKTSVPALFSEAEEVIRQRNPDLTRQKALLEGLEAIKDDYAGMGDVDMVQLQKLKEGWAQFVPEKAYKGQPIAGAVRQVSKVLSDLARQDITSALGDDVRLAYIDYGNLKGIAELGQKAMTGAKFKGGAGGWLNAVKDMVVTPIATVGGLTVYTAGRGVELIGQNGAAVVGDVIPDLTSASNQ